MTVDRDWQAIMEAKQRDHLRRIEAQIAKVTDTQEEPEESLDALWIDIGGEG